MAGNYHTVPRLGNATCEPVLVKLSGEALGGGVTGVDHEALEFLGGELLSARKQASQIAIVVGGGNFYRGQDSGLQKIERISADYVGMLGTVINGVILQQWIQSMGVKAKVLSAIPVDPIAEQYNPESAREYLKDGTMLILSGGTGNPYFTTDTTASLRALELGARTIIKATRVDGIFDADPEIFPKAKRFNQLDYDAALFKQLEVMDATALALCRDNRLTIRVINITKSGNLKKAVSGEEIGTIVRSKGEGDE